MEPVMGMFSAMENYMVYTLHQMDWMLKRMNPGNSTQNSSENGSAGWDETSSEYHLPYSPPKEFMQQVARNRQFARDIMPFVQGLSHFYSPIHNPDYANLTILPFTDIDEPMIEDIINKQQMSGRRLLQLVEDNNSTTIVDWKQELGIVEPLTQTLGYIQKYSALVAVSAKKNPNVDGYIEWLNGEDWPPFNRQDLGSCPSGAAVAKLLVGAFEILKDQMMNPPPVANFSGQKVNATFPSFHWYNGTIGTQEDTGRILYTPPSIVSMVMGGFKSFIVDILGIDIRYVIGFFTGKLTDDGLTLIKTAKGILKCDYKSVMDCQSKRSNFFTGALGVLLLLTLLYMSLGSMGALVLGGLGVVPLILWYVYGYSPSCLPMIPVCAVTDLLDTITWLIPIQLEWPSMLQKVPGCAMNESIPYQDCFIPCSDPPFRYVGWEATIAWAACDWNDDWCIKKVMPWARDNNFIILWSELVDKYNAIDNDRTGITPPDYGRIDAERFCFVVTIFNIVPYLFIGLAAVYAASAILALPFVILQWGAETFFQALAYIHTSQGEKKKHD